MATIKTLRFITLDRVYVALDDLLTKRAVALQSFPYGAFIFPELTALRDRLAKLPEIATGRPYAAELASEDARHDGFGGACWHLVEAYLLAPDTTPAQREILMEIRAALGSLDDLTAAYEAEFKAAKDRKDKIANLETAMASFPIAANKTLLDWAKAFGDAGESIGALLSKRADAKDRAAAGSLRNETIGLLNQTRRDLARAQRKDASLPADLDTQVFALFDDLEAKSAAEAAAEKKKEAERKAQSGTSTEAAPAGTPGPGEVAGGSESNTP